MLHDHSREAILVYREKCISTWMPFMIENNCAQGYVEFRSNKKIVFRNFHWFNMCTWIYDIGCGHLEWIPAQDKWSFTQSLLIFEYTKDSVSASFAK